MALSPAAPSRHIPAIDMVKGWAILGVTLIHSWALGGSLWMTLLFYHAVPVFLVIFGLNSESWFRNRPAPGRVREWYVRGIKRLLIPAYATVILWWIMVFILRPPEPMVRITLGLPFWHAIGWLNQIGTSWFVTLILQFVILFPLFHWLSRRLGGYTLLALCTLVTIGTLMFPHWLRANLGVGGWFFFPPRFFMHVAFGMLLIGRVEKIGFRAVSISVAALIFCYLVQQKILFPEFWRFGDRFLELPLTIILLWFMNQIDWIGPAEKSLSWLGRHSYGLYLGQMLTHNGLLYRFGGACDLYGCYEGVFAKFNLWIYAGVLLAGSIGFVLLGNYVVSLNQSLRRQGYRLPDLSV